ncbi:MAG: efflux RND transporter periplasmic adaptor subunit [Proteobacteria bacterium]|nr:efflux RND transporter periplasmic adaptor subunit [Pseudomonadota bacterium]
MRPLMVLAAFLLLSQSVAQAQTAPPKPIPVGVVTAALRPVTRATDYAGRIEATERVDVRARVTGFLEEVLFKEGETVKAGAPLYRIEKGPFEAAVLQARGALLQAQATFANASLQRQRADELVKTSAMSVANRDERVAAEQNAQGSVIRAEADLRTATINLSYTDIVAPIDGRIGRSAVTKGNVVGPDSGVLTVILSEDPIYTVFPVSQREFLDLQKAEAKVDAAAMVVKIRFSDGSQYPLDGKINFIDVKVDRTTDTVLVRATVPNPNGTLVDGQFVNVQVQGDKPEEQIVIPQSALLSDQGGIYVMVADNGKAVVRRIKLGANVGANVAVMDGLKPGDLVIVEGLQALRPDAPVQPSPASIGVQSN